MKKIIFIMILVFLSINIFCQSNDSIFDLAGSGTPEEVQLKINAGADVNSIDKLGRTPLMYAAVFNAKPDIISVLVKAGAEVNAQSNYGNTPLMYAAIYNENPEIISVLLEAGAEIDVMNKDGSTSIALDIF